MRTSQSAGERAVSIEGDAERNTIITGDWNKVTIVEAPAARPPLRLTRATWRPWLRAQLTPAKTVAALVSLIAFASAVVTLVQFAQPWARSAPTMASGLNVAVAQFTAFDAAGQSLDLPTLTNLGEDIQRQLDQQLRQPIGDDLAPQVAIWGPKQTLAIAGRKPQDRESAAEQRARDIHADALVYAEAVSGRGSSTLQPKLYLSSRKLDQATELIGVHAFGPPLQEDGDLTNTATLSKLGGRLLQRVRSLGQLLLGLDQLNVRHYDQAEQYFKLAQASWPGNGSELVLLFLGNAAGSRGDLDAAEAYYRQALDRNQDYPRARFGLASVLFQRAGPQADCSGPAIQLDGLRGAIAQWQQVLATPGITTLSNLQVKTQLALGQAYLCYSQAQETDDRWADARAAFGAVVDDYEHRPAETREAVQNFAAEAHAGLGYVALPAEGAEPGPNRDAAFNAAAAEYTQAARLTLRSDLRAAYYRVLAFIQGKLGQLEVADTYLARAAACDGEHPQLYTDLHNQLRQQGLQASGTLAEDATCG